MVRKYFIILALIAAVILAQSQAYSQDSLNVNCLGRYYHNWLYGVVDVAVDGDYAYLACYSAGLRIVDISRPGDASEISSLPYTAARSLAKSGDYVYLSSYTEGLNIVDVSNPAVPQPISQLYPLGWAETVRIYGNYVYLCGDGLSVVDVSNPANPTVVWSPSDVHSVSDAEVNGEMVYLACVSQGFRIYNIADISSPSLVATWETGTGNYVNGATVSGNYAYLSCGWDGLKVIDLTNMQAVAAIDSLSYGFRVKAKGPFVYTTYGDPECPLAIVDISNPLSPQTLGVYDPPEDIVEFDIQQEIVYAADFEHGLRMVDIANPAAPYEIAAYSRFGHDFDVTANGDLAFVREEFKLKIIDLVDPPNPIQPRESGYFETIFQIKDMALSGNMAYLIDDGYTCLYAVDISNPDSPNLLGTFTPTEYYPHNRIAIYNHYAYILEYNGLRIVDISDPEAMIEASFHPCNSRNAKMTIFGHYLVYQGNDMRIKVLDLTDPLSPFQVGSYNVGQYEYCMDMAREDDRLYLATESKLFVFDIINPAQWSQLASIDIVGQPHTIVRSVDVLNHQVYLAVDSLGLLVYDMNDPESAQLIGYYRTPGWACGVAIMPGEIAIVADYDNLGIYGIRTVSVDGELDRRMPETFALLSNYPNPFNGSTIIRFELEQPGWVNLGIYDILGRSIVTLADGRFQAGEHSIPWNGTGKYGQEITSGRYFVKARAGGVSKILPLTLLK